MNRVRACLYLSVFVIMGLSDAVVPILPDLSADALEQSALFSAYFAGALVSMIPLGMLSDRYGPTPFIRLSLVLTAVSGLMIFCFDRHAVLVSARFVEGCSCGAFFPAAFSIIARFENPRRYIGEFTFLLNFGLAAGVTVAAALKYYHLKAGVMAFSLLALAALAMSFSQNNGTIIRNAPQSVHDTIDGIFTVLLNERYLQMWFTAFILFGGTGVIVAYFPSFTNLEAVTQGLALSGVYVGTMITSLVGGRMNLTERCMIKTGALITGIGIIITVYHPIGLTIMGAGSGFALIGLVTGVASLDVNSGIAMGVLNTYTYAGFAALPVFAAMILGYCSYAGVFWIFGILVAVLALFPMRIRGR